MPVRHLVIDNFANSNENCAMNSIKLNNIVSSMSDVAEDSIGLASDLKIDWIEKGSTPSVDEFYTSE
jgi:hypothetical protein